ncbi:MAG: hydrogenase maturation nickel metallochaperone HypA [Selenomonadaceae bacterium]|nr:hydrogenase maturation nickel metallochaperone HypA [Selenomonadaceae bacterium]
MFWRRLTLHEATLAENILNIAFDAADKNHATKIFKVGLTLGEMAGVEVEALKFSFDVLKKNTPADGAELVIKRVPISAACNKCGKIFQLERYNFFCPECDGVLILQSGRELLVDFVDCE